MSHNTSKSIFDSYPPESSPEQWAYLVQTAKDWSIQHGLTVRPNPAFIDDQTNPEHVLATNAPITLFPSPFPKASFEQARSIQQAYNELYAGIANDEAWLEGVMKELFEVDDFIANLWKIHVAVREEGFVQDISLGLFRSDYMLNAIDDVSSPSLKQIEINTIASSFGGLSSLVTKLHTELASFPTTEQPFAYPSHPIFTLNRTQADSGSAPSKVTGSGLPPPNEAVSNLVTGLAAAHKAYGASKSKPSLPLCILFLVQDTERNLFDQMALSQSLQDKHHIPCFRLPTSQILTQTSIPDTTTNPARPLIYTPPSSSTQQFEVSTVYFRALYSPSEYNTPTSWQARHHLERSAAIKCPTVIVQLSGSKAVQQVLTSTDPDHLSRFLPSHSASILKTLRSTFAPQYSLSPSDPSSKTGLAIAKDPARAIHHVLKPQREGGGNNIYRTNIPHFLASIPEKDYKQYILMELIKPPPQAKNTLLRSDGNIVTDNVITEMSIYGTILWRRGDSKPAIMHNEEGGYMVRTKGRETDEGGVATGFSCLDSLILYE